MPERACRSAHEGAGGSDCQGARRPSRRSARHRRRKPCGDHRRIARLSYRPGEDHWTAGPHRKIHPHDSWRSRNETKQAPYTRNSRVVSSKPFTPLTLARIVRPWGRRGEVAAEILTDFPNHLTKLREAWLSDGRNPPRPVTVRSCRIHIGQAVFKFEGTDSISDAETLRGLEVQVPLADRTPIMPGRYYISELIGCTVWEQNARGSTAPVQIGTVADVQRVGEKTAPAAIESWVLSVTTPQGELLIPLAYEICTMIDVPNRRIEVRLPDGLRILNDA